MDLDNPSYFSMACDESLDLLLPDLPSSRLIPTTITEVLDNASTSSDYSLPRSKPKSFLRSCSSNSNEELLIMGEPRLSDIAPDLVPRKSSEPIRSSSLKQHKKNFDDLMYFHPPHSGSTPEDEQVFISDDSARYYNFSKPRRHSISTFAKDTLGQSSPSLKISQSGRSLNKRSQDRLTGSSPTNTRPKMYGRKQCNRCTKKSQGKSSDMDDILILSVKQSEAAGLWVEYFNNYFEHVCTQVNRKSFKIYHLGVEEVIAANQDIKAMMERTSNVKLQLIIVCPSLLEQIMLNPLAARGLGKLILQDRVLALLLGVTDEDINSVCHDALMTYPHWQRHSVGADQDENFTKEFLKAAVGILSTVWKKQSSSTQQKTMFSVLPKKVRQGHNSVIITLNDALEKEDVVTVSVERNNEIIEVKTVKRRNPYTLKIAIPESCTEVSAIVNILVEKNGSIIGSRPIKCESRLRELEQILRSTDSPMEFMCQALGFSPFNTEHLDDCLVYSFQRNLPPNFSVFSGQKPSAGVNLYCHNQEYPTLLHFAARYGLEKLTMQLLECPGGDVACEIQNSCDLTPAEMAQNGGHVGLAQTLSGYMKMNEVKNAYEKLKQMSLESKQQTSNEDLLEGEYKGYLTPVTLNSPYKKCPPPKPINRSLSNTSSTESTSSGYYMSMQSPSTKPVQNRVVKPPNSLNVNPNAATTSFKQSHTTPEITTPKSNPAIVEDKVQKELAEIINDFKNNVHSITQVEKLVEEWKNRNDVQKSFKEKQEQLNEMRARYDKIQQDMKSAMKKPTPFERLKKVFSKPKPKVEEIKEQDVATPASTINRPISSLSMQSDSSSGSSGRVSTISGCSIGDSGTHSDQEDRKVYTIGSMHDENFDSDLKKAIMSLNYMIPPPPRPLTLTKFANIHTYPIIEEKIAQSVPKPSIPSDDTYYIHFPPSGLPVPAHKILTAQDSMKSGNENKQPLYLDLATNLQQKPKPTLEYMNLQAEAVHEYMNSVNFPMNGAV